MSRDEFIGRDAKRGPPAFRRSKHQERSLARRSGGRLVSGSGSGAEKGDIAKYHGVFRVEAKTTTKNSFRVTREMITTIENVALPHGELPAIIVEFVDQMGRPISEVAIVPTSVLEELIVGKTTNDQS